MQHLFDCYGEFDIEVPCVVSTVSCCRQTDFFGHGYEYADFLEFPAMHGWKLDEENYSLRLLTLEERRAYEESRQHGPKALEVVPIKSRDAFIQAWLFFALISCIVKKDGHPLLKFSDLTRSFQQGPRTRNMNGLIDTANLQTELDEWHRSERVNRSTAKLRLVQADLILELARQVVRTNLAKGAPHDFKVDSVISISIMILGETLSAVKKKITESVRAAVRGWHAEDQEGWGPPEYVFSRMEEKRFCPHARKVLSIQMGTNATLLLAALKHHAGAKDHGDLCNMDGCQYLHQQPWAKNTQLATADSRYIPQCHPEDGGNFATRCQTGQCCKVGPDMDRIYDILRIVKRSGGDEGFEFPLFRIKESDGALSIQIHTWRKSGNKLPFATISHVWSQGLGNKEENTVHECQLRFIRKLLEAVGVPSDSTTLSAPFWLDTFAIPVRCKTLQGRANGSRGEANATISPDDFNELKQLSIRQIYDVFEASTHAIVIDKDLCQQRVMGKPIEASMKLLTSTWMRRLWTLQEAFLSKTICISFESRLDIHRTSDNPNEIPHPGWDFDILLQQLNGNHDEEKTLQAAMAGILRQQLLENLMGKERQSRNLADVSVPQKGSTLIASAWRSVRWRTTSRLEDETLALATLLHLSYRDTTISQAGGVVQGLDKPDAAKQRDGMMRDFWTLIDRRYKGSIPAGMIFLPLDRLTFPGFGWSPRSWMSSTTDIEPESYPYPLSQMKYPTELLPEGLVVRYPGIILHCTRPETFLAQKEEGFTFDFPVDRGFNEWYTVGKHFERVEPDATEITEAKQTLWFAIILSRPQPRERPDEIGLLVEVYNVARRQNEGESQDHEIYFCRIIDRFHIRRSRPNFFNGLTDDRLIGELTSVDQHWCVDDYKPCRDRIRAEEDEKSRNAQALKRAAKLASRKGDDKSILARGMQGILSLTGQAPLAIPASPRLAEMSGGGGKGKELAVPVRRETSSSTGPAGPSSVHEENTPFGKMARSLTGTVTGQFNRIATLAKGH